MKEICQCNCSSPATAYRTPWCSMLRGGEQTEILHLWYKLEWLRKEVRQRLAYLGSTQNYAGAPNVFDLVGATPTSDTPLWFQFNFAVSEIKNAVQKRTAYLGKLRRSEDAVHLLDLIAFTDDEEDLFVEFAKETMPEVWNTLSAPFVAIEKRAWWQDKDTATFSAGIVYQFDEAYPITENDMQPLKTAVMEAIVMRIIWKWLTLSYPSEAAAYDTMYQQSLVTLTQRTNEFKARWVNVFVPHAKAAMADVFDVLNTYMPKHEKAYFFRESKETIILPDFPDENSLHLSRLDADNVDEDGFIVADTIPEDENGYIQISETGVDADGFIAPEDHPTGLLVYFHTGDYVRYKGELYMAIADGNSRDFVGKLVPTEDYRDSVHYGLNWRCCGSNINAVEPLDTAIFEALVARIIYKWLCMSYPAEAERYQAEWLEHLEAIRRRCNILNGPQIVNRISRLF